MKRIAALVATVGLVSLLGAASAGAFTAQEKLLARNAAEADAYGKLAKEVKGLWIDGISVVKDFVTEVSVSTVAFDAFVKGARIVKTTDREDGMSEVEMEISLPEFVRNCEEIRKTYYNGQKPYEFTSVSERTQYRTIKVTGYGAPRTAAPAPAAPAAAPAAAVEANPAAYETFAQKAMAAVGTQYTAQQQLMCKNAAEVDAYGKLAKQVKGVYIDGIDVVRDFATEQSIRTVKFDAFIKGAGFTNFAVSPDGICTATASIMLAQVVKNINDIKETYYNGQKPYEFSSISQKTTYQTVTVDGYGAMKGDAPAAASAPTPGPAFIPGSIQ